MNYEELILKMTPQMHSSIKTAIELGKWPDGKKMTGDQLDICMRAIIAYDQKLPQEQRTGFIDRTKADGSIKGSDPLEQVIKLH
ncbi:MAG: hypothetical protein ACI9ES_000533 [Oceanospirillaceae bacterium]|jgi:uncharacterized protein YeaC (DUF1315 family)